MGQNLIQNSFNAGELSPTLFGRQDLAKYHSGAALMRNFFVDYRGGASNRAGTRFCARGKTDTLPIRLIPFKFSTIQQYILEFGDQYMRVYFNGAPVLEPSLSVSAVTQANPAQVTSAAHGFANGDTVYFTGALGMTQINQKTYLVANATTNTFTLQTLNGANVNSTAYGAYAGGATVARVYTLTTPYAGADLALIKFTQSADTMTLTHPLYQPRDLTRTQHYSWTLTPITYQPSISSPGAPTVTPSSASTTAFSYCVTAVSALDGTESRPSPVTTNTACVNISATAGSINITWASVPNAKYYKLYKVGPAITGSVIPTGAAYGYIGLSFGNQFVDTNITPDFTETPPGAYNPFANYAVTGYTISSGGTGYTTGSTASVGGGGTGASLTPIVLGGAVTGFIINNGGQDYNPATVSVTIGSGLVATLTTTPASGNYPGAVCYFQQRKVFAASLNFPATLWGTRPGQYKNFDLSFPTNAGDSYSYTISSQQVNAIKSMLPMPGGLVLFTSDGVWQLKGDGQSTAVTPLSASADPQAYTGASDVPPIAINYDILYVQDKGSIVRNLTYNYFAQIYTSEDKSFLSNHFFANGLNITEWTYAAEPFKTIWATRSDGRALSFCFMREQDVYGWASSDTQGQFMSVASIQETVNGQKTDSVYWVVRRYIQGQWVQYIERMEPRYSTSRVEDAWFLDCALAYTGSTPAANLTISAATGNGVTVTADAAVFSAGNVGQYLRAGGGKMKITNFLSATQLVGNIEQAITDIVPIVKIPLPVVSGRWTIAASVSTLSGLDHLEGQTVRVLADGNVKADQVVTNGMISVANSPSRVVAGLKYECKLVTMPLDAGQPTIQGKRKAIPQATLKVTATRGLKVGPSFDRVYPALERIDLALGTAIPPFDGDLFYNLTPNIDTYGQTFMYSDEPLPVTVLALVNAVDLGT